jgi:hypothetical protein
MRIRGRILSGLAALALAAMPGTALARTFYVNPVTGSNEMTESQAQSPATPVKTVKRALRWAGGGDTVLVVVPSPPNPVALVEPATIESKRDGAAGAPIVVRCETAGLCVWTPPAGTNGFFVSHNHHIIDGFKVVGGRTGIQVGEHDGGGPLFGGIVQNNIVQGAASNGVQCAKCQGVEIAFNTVTGSNRNGIRYQGNAGLIHDNTANDNAQFGIYVVDGADHQVWANAATGNGQGQIQIAGALLPQQRTFYVGPGGSDARTVEQAQSPATPWLTIQKGLNEAQPGDTVLVLPGTYGGAESKVDGDPSFPITLRSSVPGGATIQAGSTTSALVIGHHHHVVDGFVITGSRNGIQLGPHEVGDGRVRGLQAINNIVHGNAAAGIKFSNARRGSAMHNVVYANGQEGIAYDGDEGTIFNNLVHGNGTAGGKYGIALASGGGHTVASNTVHGNVVGGLRLGTANAVPVFSAVRNNIVTGNPVGVKEPGGSTYAGRATLEFNNVQGNDTDYDLGPSRKGPGSISVPPGYVDAGGGDFRLRRNSQCVDQGSVAPDAAGLAGRTAFADKSPDEPPRVDLGHHGTLLRPSEGAISNLAIQITLGGTGGDNTFTLSARLTEGPDSDGLGLGSDYVEIALGGETFTLPASGFTHQGGGTWTFSGPGPLTSATFTKSGDHVDLSVAGSSAELLASATVLIRIGDDTGTASVAMRGTLVFP